ncbi:MAG: two-component system, OmpR family, sensor kinase [Elusimicrobia bacterium]|nr:MAG: two-component system, OmpR family, sensor kinase [Elusimicrobiota bacterium]
MTLQTRLQDDVPAFTAAFVGACLEVFLVAVLLCDRRFALFGIANPAAFFAAGQAFLLAACIVAKLAARAFLDPLADILLGVHQFRQGNLTHRIPPSRVKEIDALAGQLNRMAGDLSSLEAMKDDFVTTVSHELRSPMAAVEGYAALLSSEAGLTPRGAANIEKIAKNMSRLRSLVESILDLSRMAAGSLPVANRPTALAPLVSETAALFAEAMRARGVELQVELPADLPLAVGDPVRVRQVVTNLLDNAIKYNRRGGRVAVTGRRDGGFVELAVSDQGPGIPEADREAVFSKFRRLPQADPELASVKGVGLGLPISRGLARVMGGDVLVFESSGGGSRFVLRLPGEATP